MSKLKQYRLNGLRFCHDDRGQFVRDGGIAWLSVSRADRITKACERDGILDVLLLAEDKTKAQAKKPDRKKPGKDSKPDSTAAKGAEAEPISVGAAGRALGLHFSKRKQLAASISGAPVTTSAEANTVIKNASEAQLLAALKVVDSED